VTPELELDEKPELETTPELEADPELDPDPPSIDSGNRLPAQAADRTPPAMANAIGRRADHDRSMRYC
jgi:hypothetical protein